MTLEELSTKVSNLKLNTRFTALNGKEDFYLIQKIEKDGKTKLKEPLFVWQYTNDNRTFTNRFDDVKRALLFKDWIEVKNEDENRK